MATACRDAASECDLPEYCDGESEVCPADVFLQNGKECGNGKVSFKIQLVSKWYELML